MYKSHETVPRGIPSAMRPGSTLSDSLGELNTCRGIFWGLASCARNYWTRHKLNMVSQGLHFIPIPRHCCSSQPWILPCFCSLMLTNLCVPLSSLPLLPACLLQPPSKMSCIQEVAGTLRQAHSLHVRNPGSQNLLFKMPVLPSVFFFNIF